MDYDLKKAVSFHLIEQWSFNCPLFLLVFNCFFCFFFDLLFLLKILILSKKKQKKNHSSGHPYLLEHLLEHLCVQVKATNKFQKKKPYNSFYDFIKRDLIYLVLIIIKILKRSETMIKNVTKSERNCFICM